MERSQSGQIEDASRMVDAAESAILEHLDGAVWRAVRLGNLDAAIRRVRAELSRDESLKLAWEPVPLASFDPLPAAIRSAWVFILRASTSSGAERHPNSIQRVMSYRGAGDLQIWDGSRWVSRPLTSDPRGRMEQRWLSIPENVWHRPVIPAGGDWAVISFHTATDLALIEERAIDDENPDAGSCKHEVYAGRSGR
jgi:hypothetical protein